MSCAWLSFPAIQRKGTDVNANLDGARAGIEGRAPDHPPQTPQSIPLPPRCPHTPRMLDWQTILWCHTRVPVYYWPVLWLYLQRLSDTFEVYAEEGRRFFRWHLERNGVIWVEWCDESDEERARRGAMHRDFNRTPWTALDPDLRAERLAALGSAMVDKFVLFLYRQCTAAAPFLHRPDTGLETRAPP